MRAKEKHYCLVVEACVARWAWFYFVEFQVIFVTPQNIQNCYFRMKWFMYYLYTLVKSLYFLTWPGFDTKYVLKFFSTMFRHISKIHRMNKGIKEARNLKHILFEYCENFYFEKTKSPIIQWEYCCIQIVPITNASRLHINVFHISE